MALMAPRIAPKPAHQGSGGAGKLIGLLAGGAIGAVTGGPGLAALGGALKGAATGAGIGGTIGETVDPAKAQEQAMQANALERRQKAMESDPMRALREAQTALPELPKDLQEQINAPLQMAMQRLKQNQVG